jgi:hypothetical protein
LDALIIAQEFKTHELLVNYKKTILVAVAEVNNAIANLRAARQRLKDLQTALAESRRQFSTPRSDQRSIRVSLAIDPCPTARNATLSRGTKACMSRSPSIYSSGIPMAVCMSTRTNAHATGGDSATLDRNWRCDGRMA